MNTRISPLDDASVRRSEFLARVSTLRWVSSLTDDDHRLLLDLVGAVPVSELAAQRGVSSKTLYVKLNSWAKALQLKSASQLPLAYVIACPEQCQSLDPVLRPPLPSAKARDSIPEKTERPDNGADGPTLDGHVEVSIAPASVVGLPSQGARLTVDVHVASSSRSAAVDRYLVLNPVFWYVALTEQREIRLDRKSFDRHAAAISMTSHLLFNLTRVAGHYTKEETLMLSELDSLVASNEELFLPVALTLRWIGRPLSPDVSTREADYEKDFGAQWHDGWAKQALFRMDSSEGQYNRSLDLAKWKWYSAELRSGRRPPAGTWVSELNSLNWATGPMVGMLTVVWAMMHTNSFEDGSWKSMLVDLVARRCEYLRSCGIEHLLMQRPGSPNDASRSRPDRNGLFVSGPSGSKHGQAPA